MKKKTIVLIVVLFIMQLFNLYATNNQTIQDINGDVDEAISALLISQGKTPGTNTLPYSNSELINMLSRVDINDLDDDELLLYNYISDIANKKPNSDYNGVGLNWNTDLALELYAHSNINYIGRDKWDRGWNEQNPFVNFSLDILPANNFYFYTEFPLENYRIMGADKISQSEDFGSKYLMANIPTVGNLSSFQLKDLSFEFPLRAFGAVGGDNWTFEVGKDQLSWGNGETGNFMFGDHIRFHNMIRYTSFSPVFKYSFVTSFFSHPSAYQSDGDSDGYIDQFDYQADYSENELFSGIKMMMAHRFEWNITDNFNFTLSESVMYQNEDNLIDLRVLNPIALYHNYYIRSYANSLLLFEANYTPIRHINIYGQLAIDEFVLPGETSSAVIATQGYKRPKAWGMMLGIKGSLPMDGGLYYASFEAVRTDPYLYLRDGIDKDSYDAMDPSSRPTNYSIDYVVATRDWNDTILYEPEFVGYKYGGDAIVFNLNSGYKKYNKWAVEGNIFYMLHGTFDIYSKWENFKSYVTPTTSNNNGSIDQNAGVKNSVSRTLVAGINGSYQLNNHTETYAQLDYVHIVNPKNNSANSNINDLQLSTGIKYSF